jgi:hypothetical protein
MHKYMDSKWFAGLILMAALLTSLWFKVDNLDIGAPYVTIDDGTMYEAGFLVWFGQAPPQRTYVESWVSGLSSIGTYVLSSMNTGGQIGINIVSDAYQDFYHNPDPYVFSYRLLMLCIDLATAFLVFLLARRLLPKSASSALYSSVAASLYLLSYNTIWSDAVARPDTLTAFFSTLGLLFYYSSKFGEQKRNFYLAAIFLGIATGVKLHAALFVVFIFIDYLRVKGFRRAFMPIIPFGAVSVVSFFVAAGSPLFDPLTYIKLRVLNIKDDASPWIEWGDQFTVLLQGAGWLIIPIIILFVLFGRPSWGKNKESALHSALFIALCWVLVFCLIRQLRAYWMLPALPLLYIVAVSCLQNFKSEVLSRQAVAGIAIMTFAVIFTSQSVAQYKELQAVNYSNLKEWVIQNIEQDESFFILGFETVTLPLSTKNIENRRAMILKKIDASLSAGESFTLRHVRFWEERSRLMLFSMLNYKTRKGYDYYGIFSTPPAEYSGVYQLESMDYILVQEGFGLESDVISQLLATSFKPTENLVGPGGGGRGLSYKVYEKR